MIAFLGTLFILAITILKVKLQTFYSNVLMRESYEKCCNWLKSHNTLWPHNLIFLISFVLVLSPKQWCFTNFHLQIIGHIWLTEKFAFTSDAFLQAQLHNEEPIMSLEMCRGKSNSIKNFQPSRPIINVSLKHNYHSLTCFWMYDCLSTGHSITCQ